MSRLEEIRARTERNASLRSDDFGHDCQALLVAESAALQVAADDIAWLIAEVERLKVDVQFLIETNKKGIASWKADNAKHEQERDSLTREVAALRSVLSEYGSDHSGFSQWIIANEIRDEREGKRG